MTLSRMYSFVVFFSRFQYFQSHFWAEKHTQYKTSRVKTSHFGILIFATNDFAPGAVLRTSALILLDSNDLFGNIYFCTVC